MARQRRTSAPLETTRQRLAGLKQIDPAPDFGGNLNAAGGQALVTDLSDELDGYNQDNAALDERQNVVDRKEEGASDWNKRVLAAVGAKYGTDSSEYEMVGGTRLSERKRSPRKGPGGSKPPTP
ncbi:MAG: hypothetical protein QOE96_1879 [Blastocatellia bacterium]|jgi:hypothetical protein|nr:hypothetical protein [Blastocatellia bacterium]